LWKDCRWVVSRPIFLYVVEGGVAMMCTVGCLSLEQIWRYPSLSDDRSPRTVLMAVGPRRWRNERWRIQQSTLVTQLTINGEERYGSESNEKVRGCTDCNDGQCAVVTKKHAVLVPCHQERTRWLGKQSAETQVQLSCTQFASQPTRHSMASIK
jgi:hypothetical protein